MPAKPIIHRYEPTTSRYKTATNTANLRLFAPIRGHSRLSANFARIGPPEYAIRLPGSAQTLGKNGRGGEIRTHDLLHPKQARIPGYATPRPNSPRPGDRRAPGNITDYGPEFNNFQAFVFCSQPFASTRPVADRRESGMVSLGFWKGGESPRAVSTALGRKVRTPKSAMPCNLDVCASRRSGYTRAECLKHFDGKCHRKQTASVSATKPGQG
jgi:hypothetical protein